MITQGIFEIAEKLVSLCMMEEVKVSTAESCTGGLVSAYITAVPGSSKVIEESYVVYSNNIKNKILGVSKALLDDKGAVCEEVAIEMLKGLLTKTAADYGVSITGLAGPTSGDEKKPVGLVYIGYGSLQDINVKELNFKGDRNTIRQQAAKEALELLLNYIKYAFELPVDVDR